MKAQPSPSKWTAYRQLSVRIGKGQAADDYLARIDAAMALARRKTRADWVKLVIDLALDHPGLLDQLAVKGVPHPAGQRTQPARRRARSAARPA